MDMWKWFEGWLDDQEVCIGPISHNLQGSAFIKISSIKIILSLVFNWKNAGIGVSYGKSKPLTICGV